jgi:tetratricopeptide (TPR) repeat protein
MRDSLAGSVVLVVFLGGPLSTGRTAELSEQRFVDWSYYKNAGWRAAERGDFAEAARRFTLAADVLRPEWERAPGLMAHNYADLAWVLYQQGRANEAEPLARWALDVRVTLGGDGSEPAARSFYELALIQDARGQLPAAESLMRRAIAAWEKRLGPYDVRVTFYLTELARLLLSQRKLDEAEAVYRRILGFPERALPPKHPHRVVSLVGLGRVYTFKGEPLRARLQDEKVLPILQNLPPRDYAAVAEPLSDYISQLRQAGRAVDAGRLEDGARAVLARIGNAQDAQIAAFRRVLTAARVPAQGASGGVPDDARVGLRTTADARPGSRSAYTPPPAAPAPPPAPTERPAR